MRQFMLYFGLAFFLVAGRSMAQQILWLTFGKTRVEKGQYNQETI